eukprot:scaffold16721_cov87-Isochrysis_galbana.AAC.1
MLRVGRGSGCGSARRAGGGLPEQQIPGWVFSKISVEFSTKRKIAVQFCKISDQLHFQLHSDHLKFQNRRRMKNSSHI